MNIVKRNLISSTHSYSYINIAALIYKHEGIFSLSTPSMQSFSLKFALFSVRINAPLTLPEVIEYDTRSSAF